MFNTYIILCASVLVIALPEFPWVSFDISSGGLFVLKSWMPAQRPVSKDPNGLFFIVGIGFGMLHINRSITREEQISVVCTDQNECYLLIRMTDVNIKWIKSFCQTR